MDKVNLSQIQFGACAWGYEMLAPGDVKGFRRVAEKVSKLPFPKRAEVIEILDFLDAESHEANLRTASEKKKIAKDLGLRVIVTGFNPNMLGPKDPSPHLTSEDYAERRDAITRMKRGIIHASLVAEDKEGILNGPSYMRHEYFPKEGLRGDEHKLLVDILRQDISPFAKKQNNTRVALEPLNHDEGYLMMPGNESLKIVCAVGKNIGINLDTTHYAQNAEGSMPSSLRNAMHKGKGFTLHLSENDRRQWGNGDNGARTLEIIQSFNYNIPANQVLPVTLENFCPDLYGALRIHRPSKMKPGQIVTNGADYIRRVIELAEAEDFD
ncbi:MAG: TIM barrel protein [Nanoarchaeota archaeon]|nr:TIM barrel protein [Nanoarchaeota archaeon]